MKTRVQMVVASRRSGWGVWCTLVMDGELITEDIDKGSHITGTRTWRRGRGSGNFQSQEMHLCTGRAPSYGPSEIIRLESD